MAVGSILLSILAFGCAVIGFFMTPVPVVGAAFSFAAPAVALAGSIMGGRAVSQAKREGKTGDAARVGVILNAIAFVPALLTAMFCGVCNALCSTGNVHFERNVSFGVNQGQQPVDTAGIRALPPPAQAPAAPTPTLPGAPTAQPSAAPTQAVPSVPSSPSSPPSAAPAAAPAMPPPPLPAGPQQGR